MAMSTSKISFEDFLRLPPDNHGYELNEGELLVTPSPTPYHNTVCYRLRRALTDFVAAHRLGAIVHENDFRLAANTVRQPDVAFLAADRIKDLDIHTSPIDGAPTLAIEVISPANSALDMIRKVHQYLNAGCRAVWVVYPPMNLIAVHDSRGSYEVTDVLEESKIFAGRKFTISLAQIFDEDLSKP
jgi:Uma2 family endonuclease